MRELCTEHAGLNSTAFWSGQGTSATCLAISDFVYILEECTVNEADALELIQPFAHADQVSACDCGPIRSGCHDPVVNKF